MANTIRFACSSLTAANKAGVLSKDSDGNYEIVVGGLNVFNSAGQFYVYEQARELFEQSSQFMRRVKRGVLKGELGHPKPLPGMSEDQFAHRVMSIYEDNVCCIHKEIFLDFDRIKDEKGNPIIAIVSKVSPSGPHGDQLRKSLENPGENVCFSIRSFTDDFRDRGVTKRILRTIVTFDQVTEPGIAFAEKFKSPALEELADRLMSRGAIERGLVENEKFGMGMESVTLTGAELFRSMGWHINPKERPAYLDW